MQLPNKKACEARTLQISHRISDRHVSDIDTLRTRTGHATRHVYFFYFLFYRTLWGHLTYTHVLHPDMRVRDYVHALNVLLRQKV